jgi:hypothetical protein
LQLFGERYDGDAALNHTDAQPSLLTIVIIRVGPNHKNAAEHFIRLGEIEAVLADVRAVLDLVPFKKSL